MLRFAQDPYIALNVNIALAKYSQVEYNLEEGTGMVLSRGSLLMMGFERHIFAKLCSEYTETCWGHIQLWIQKEEMKPW